MADGLTPDDAPRAATRTAAGLMAFYNAVYAERSMRLPRHLWPVCMALADQRIQKLMLIIGPGSGKSSLLSVAYPAWELGLDATQTVLGISAGENLMQGFQLGVQQLIEWSSVYRAIFPRTMPDKSTGWSLERGCFVSGHKPGDPDASYFCCGITSSALTGKHAKIILLDDIHNRENSASVEACDKVAQTYYDTIIGRADPAGARFILAGRRWHEKDIYGRLMDSGEWVVMVLPAERPGQTKLYFDVIVPDGLICCFNEQQMAA